MNDEPSELKTVKFNKGLFMKEPTNIVLGISMGNEKQEGNDLMAYVNSLNSNIKNIKEAEFLVTGHLHRHYVGEENARKMHEDWVSSNKEILSNLKMPYKITDWKNIIETSEFKNALVKINEIYEKDTGFRIKVENVARSHITKADMKTVTNYLLEEAAYFFMYKGNFAYPADKLNTACMHIIQNYNTYFTFRGYGLMPPKKIKNDTQPILMPSSQQQPSTQIPAPRRNSPPKTYTIEMEDEITPQTVFMYCSQVSYLMDKIGLHGSQNKEQFFSKFIKGQEECMQLVPQRLIQHNGVQNNGSTTTTTETLKVGY